MKMFVSFLLLFRKGNTYKLGGKNMNIIIGDQPWSHMFNKGF